VLVCVVGTWQQVQLGGVEELLDVAKAVETLQVDSMRNEVQPQPFKLAGTSSACYSGCAFCVCSVGGGGEGRGLPGGVAVTVLCLCQLVRVHSQTECLSPPLPHKT
jgi:hypothetical protein